MQISFFDDNPIAKTLFKIALFASLLIYFTSCSGNLFSELATKDSDAAILFQIKIHLSKKEYTQAESLFSTLSAAKQAERDVLFLQASAYAGLCGLDFLAFSESFSSIGTTLFLKFLMQQFNGVTAASVTNCKSAESTLLTIGSTAATRTDDENVLMVFLQFAKIGAILNLYADTDDDGSADVGFDACSTGSLTDEEAGNIATGIHHLTDSMAKVSSIIDVGESGSGVLTQACTDLETLLGATFNFCAVTDPTALTADQQRAVRSVIGESGVIGIGSCTDGSGGLDGVQPGGCICP